MSKLVSAAAADIQLTLANSESDIDRAIASSASLLATMTTARVETGSPFGTGQVAIMRLVKSIAALSEARADMARVHADLLRVARERADYVGIDECPSGAAQANAASLKLVA